MLLTVENLNKTFPGVKALKNVNLVINRNTIHGLVGENGSGKSTLIKIIAGVLQPDPGGKILIEGKPINFLHSIDAMRKGVAVIFQDFSLFENLSVSENISLPQIIEESRHIVNWGLVKKQSREIINKLGIDIDMNTIVGNLSIANQQVIAIARAISGDAKLLIMDEPTSALSQNEVITFFNIIKNLMKSGNVSILFISHKLDEVLTIADVITVIRDGSIIGTYEKGDIDSKKLISLITGKEVSEKKYIPEEFGNLILEVKGLTKLGNYKDISFKLHSGEILGITGLLGSGKTELAKSLFGLNMPTSGGIYVENQKVKIGYPALAKKYGIAYISEDRKNESLIMSQSVIRNLIITVLQKLLNKFGLLNIKKGKELTEYWIKKLNIKVPYMEISVLNLSGGNQQRVSIAKWLATKPKVLILDNPTAGIDVGAKSEIFEILHDLAKKGIGILLISPEALEVVNNCNRIIIMKKGKIVAEYDSKEVTKDEIMEKSILG
ncbi:MAG: sugar ABC transporter ATP-binding protein [Actinobacteria bacterium]|nr:sugar ABC transporter ATP-binding protein [Actinomycetota bacterium]